MIAMKESYFDKHASTWGSDRRNRRTIHIYEQLRERMPSSGSALEIGCGNGFLASLLSRHLRHIDCIDASNEMRRAAQETLQAAGVQNVDIHEEAYLSFANKKYDLIYSLSVFHHIPDVGQELRLLHSLLKDEGVFYLMDLGPVPRAFHSEFENYDGHDGFSKDTIEHYLNDAGFQITDYKIVWEGHNADKNMDYYLFLAEVKKSA